MPHPINNPAGLTARGGPRIILERPRLAALIGAVAAEWGDIDNMLAEIFNLVSLAKPIPFGAHSTSKLAYAIFDSVISFPGRMEMITNVMRLRVDPDICDEFKVHANGIRTKSKIRNNLIHANWQICEKYPEDLIRIVDEKWVRYTEPDITFNLDESVELRNKINDFVIKVAQSPKRDVD